MTKWCALKVRLDCPECGSTVFVDGPYKKVVCHACGSDVRLTTIWKSLVRNALDDGGRGKMELAVQVSEVGPIYLARQRDQPPPCSYCGAEMSVSEEDVATGTNGEVVCPSCGGSHPTWPAPGFLKKAGVQQVFLAPPPQARRKPEADTPPPAPVCFGCLNCGANLKIGVDDKRIVTCAYCQSDNYLPHEVWNRLHPVRRRRAFWLRCGTNW
ncbi:MAG: hypothetical protein AAGA56_04620 [Myxococcota bacterium]